MSVIEAATAGFKDMADGTVRFFFDVEPRHAGAALELFRARGTPAALAALQVGYAAIPPDSRELEQPDPVADMGNPITEKPKGGALAKLAGMWCADPEFWAWVNKSNFGYGVSSPDDAAQFVRDMCDIGSRAELDNNPQAAGIFHQSIRGPYSRHLMARGIVA